MGNVSWGGRREREKKRMINLENSSSTLFTYPMTTKKRLTQKKKLKIYFERSKWLLKQTSNWYKENMNIRNKDEHYHKHMWK